ncbi:MAG TPA: BsuPI-related putative proteinase inhibitor [Longimicrobiaceae bacterium]|nr:BsuPI-related putative proteinase inhibitor [Longimicrobiaceae bacterium]
MRTSRSVPLLAALWLAACQPPAPAATPEPAAGAAGPLVSSLTIDAAHDSVRFSLAVTNVAAGPVTLEFPTAQRYDFAVRDGARELWRWSADRSFAQAAGSETLAPGETRSYTEVWRPTPGSPGRGLTGIGVLTAGSRVERAAPFTVP